MHKKHNNIDELFKSELSGLETPAPAFVKKQIDKKLFKKNKFYFLLFILLLAVLGMVLFSNSNTDLAPTEKSHSNTIFNNEEDRKEKHSTFSTKSKTTIEEQFKRNNYSSNADTPNILTKNKNNKTSLSLKNTATTSFIDVSSKQSVNNSKVKNDKNHSNPVTAKTRSKSQHLSEVNSSNKNNTIINNNSKATKHEIKRAKNPIEDQNKVDTIQHADTINSETIINVSPSQSPTEENKNNLELDTLSQSTVHIKDGPKTNNSIDSPEINSESPVKSKTISYLLSWTSGINLTKSTYISPNDNTSSYYQSNHTENNNFEHNLSLNTLLKNNFTVGTGIGTSQHSYDFSYNEETISTLVTTDTSSIFVNYIYASTDTFQVFSPIDSVYQTIIDTISTTTSTSNTSFNGTSQAQYIHIPLQLGYIYEKNKFMFGIQINARYNILTKASGQSFENNIVSSFDKTNPIFKKSYFDFAVKADVYYNVFDNFYVNTSFKYIPKLNNTYQNLPVERKVKYLHFGLGLSYLF